MDKAILRVNGTRGDCDGEAEAEEDGTGESDVDVAASNEKSNAGVLIMKQVK